MTVTAETIAGPFGPDTLRLPGDPERLRRAHTGLDELSQQLEDVGQRLREADAPKNARGRTVRSLSNVAGRTGRVLKSDVERITELSEALQHEIDVLSDAKGLVTDLRQRWRQARQEVRDQLTADQAGGGGDDDKDKKVKGGTDPSDIIRSVDADVLEQHGPPLERLAGLHFMERGGHGAFLMEGGGEAQQAMRGYRQALNGIMEELVEAVRRVHRADERLTELLPRQDKAVLVAQEADFEQAGDGPDNTAISRPDDIDSVGQEVQEAARTLNHVTESLREIRLAMREGRMTPEDDRIGSMEGFQRTWTEHLDELREDLNHARRASTDIADQLRQLDERGARDVRRSGRGGDGGGKG